MRKGRVRLSIQQSTTMFNRVLERERKRLRARRRSYIGWSKPGKTLDHVEMKMWSGAISRVVAQCDHLSLTHCVAVCHSGRIMGQVIITCHRFIRVLDPDQVLMAEDVVSFEETHLKIHNLATSARDNGSAGWHGKIYGVVLRASMAGRFGNPETPTYFVGQNVGRCLLGSVSRLQQTTLGLFFVRTT